MTNEKAPPIIGGILLAVGIVVLFFTFYQTMLLAQNPGDYFREQFPEEEEEAQGPEARFSWSSDNLDAWFMDESEEGDTPITSWEWSFGDGSTSSEQNPSHTFNSDGDYRVRLRVEDQNGLTSSVDSNLYIERQNQNNGESEGDYGDFNFEMGNFALPFAAAILVGILFIVMYLVGASLVKAGWNLLKPGPSTIKMKIKPKKLEVEQVTEEPMYATQKAPAASMVTAQPNTVYAAPVQSAGVIASMQALPANSPAQAQPAQPVYAQPVPASSPQGSPAPQQAPPQSNPTTFQPMPVSNAPQNVDSVPPQQSNNANPQPSTPPQNNSITQKEEPKVPQAVLEVESKGEIEQGPILPPEGPRPRQNARPSTSQPTSNIQQRSNTRQSLQPQQTRRGKQASSTQGGRGARANTSGQAQRKNSARASQSNRGRPQTAQQQTKKGRGRPKGKAKGKKKKKK
jgi:PKD repeat protein